MYDIKETFRANSVPEALELLRAHPGAIQRQGMVGSQQDNMARGNLPFQSAEKSLGAATQSPPLLCA